jgi:murein DD-endopeptidase MepM/ murein hydrolase activator NlpD
MSRTLRLVLLLVAVVALVAVPPPARASAPAKVAAAARWSWPVAGAHPITRPFIAPVTQYSAGHRGIDIAASGDVLAPADGVVHFVGFVVDRPVLSISHPGGVLSSYEPVVSSLHEGDVVTRGEVIGQIVSGHCAQLCLHLGVRVDGEYVSPMLFLGGIPYSVLLPTRTLERDEKQKAAWMCLCG